MIGRGTTSRSAESFSREMAQLGTSLASDAGREYATLSSAFLSRDFESGLELVADAVTHPVFLEEELRRVRTLSARGVAQFHQNALPSAIEQLWSFALPELPAARPPLGRIESIARLTRDQSHAFHRDRYRPDGSVLAIVGDVTPERAFAAAAEWFGSWQAGVAPVPAAPGAVRRAPGTPRIRVLDQAGSEGCAIAVGLKVPGRSSADALARSVAASLFEHQLAERVARGTFRDARAALELTRDHGLWVVQATAPADSAAVLARRLTDELKRFLASPPVLTDVMAAQQRIRRGFPLAFETSAALAGQWLLADFAGFPADYFDGYVARLSALRPNDLHAAARRETDLAKAEIVAIGPVVVATLDPLPEAAPVHADTLPAPTAEQLASGRKLIVQALTAHGGREKLAGIRTSHVDAAIRFQVPGSEVNGTLRQLRKEPDKLSLMTSVRGVDTRQTLNGSRAWTVVADSDTALQGDSLDVAALRIAFTSDLPHLLLAAADKNARVAARGRERVAGRDADRVEVVAGTDPWRMLYLDAATHRLLAFDQRERGPRGYYLARRVYGDFRPLGGIQWPYQEERFVEGQPLMKLDVTGVELNSDLSEKQFEPPAVPGVFQMAPRPPAPRRNPR
jgi:zinc protease